MTSDLIIAVYVLVGIVFILVMARMRMNHTLRLKELDVQIKAINAGLVQKVVTSLKTEDTLLRQHHYVNHVVWSRPIKEMPCDSVREAQKAEAQKA